MNFTYRAITFFGGPFQALRLSIQFLTSRRIRNSVRSNPATPDIQRLRAWHISGLGYFHFARRYFENHCCFLFLRVLRWFSSPRSPPAPMNSVRDVPALPGTGFPIQRSPDQSLFSSSPKLIAACRVFHRLLAPRHPPLALSNLATAFTHVSKTLLCAYTQLSKSISVPA